MPNKYIPKGRSTRGNWKEEDLINATDDIKNGTSVRRASEMFSIPRKTLERKLKTGNVFKGPMGPSPSLGKGNEERLVRHIKKMQTHGFPLTRDDLRSLAYSFAQQLGLKHRFNKEKEKAGYDWLQLFLSRHPDLCVRKCEGVSIARVQGMNRNEVKQYFSLLKNILVDNSLINKPSSIFNMDETGLQMNNRPGLVVAEKGSKAVCTVTSGEKGETITILACCNAEGMFLPPTAIMKGKNKKKEWEDNMPPGSVVMMSEKSAYVNTAIFFDWLKNQFHPRKPAGKVLLILDGHASHCNSVEMLEFAEAHGIILLCLPSHTTHYLQPLDRAVFKSVKQYFYSAASKWLTNHHDRKLTRMQFGELLSECWGKAATPENAISGFRATGIYPLNEDAIPDYAFIGYAANDSQEQQPNARLDTRPENFNNAEDSTGVFTSDPLQISQQNLDASGMQNNTHLKLHEGPSTSRQSREIFASTEESREQLITHPSITTSQPLSPRQSAQAFTPTKVLNDISPVPARQKREHLGCRKLKATLLTSRENIAKIKTTNSQKAKKFAGKNKLSRPVSTKDQKRRKLFRNNKNNSSSSSSEAEVESQDKSSNDFVDDNEQCVGCGEEYNVTKQNCDWIQCVRCHRWLHESCTSFIDVCQRCGEAITSKM